MGGGGKRRKEGRQEGEGGEFVLYPESEATFDVGGAHTSAYVHDTGGRSPPLLEKVLGVELQDNIKATLLFVSSNALCTSWDYTENTGR